MVTKIQQLAGIAGYSDVNTLIAASAAHGAVLGICMNRRCSFVKEVEKDQKHGYCETCGSETVKSAIMLKPCRERNRRTRTPGGDFPSVCRMQNPYQFNDCELVQFVTGASMAETRELLRKFGGAAAVIGASVSEMIAQNISNTIARRIRTFQEAAAAHHWRKVAHRIALTSWTALLDYLSVSMAAHSVEEFHVLFLDRKNVLLADELMGKGTVDHAPVYPREIVKRALVLNASAVILAHNHPSGDPTPSRADIEMTREVVDACKALRIAVHDHLVIGRAGTASFKALGLL